MAQRLLVKNYLREAAVNADAPGGTDEQIAWLETQRVALSAEVNTGDWSVTSTSQEGQSHTSNRGITAADRLAAVIAALEQLEENDAGAGGRLLIPRLDNLPL